VIFIATIVLCAITSNGKSMERVGTSPALGYQAHW
jgi:hypothetical protein